MSNSSLTKKQKAAFKKMCSIHGPSFVRNSLKNGKQEIRDFIFQIALIQGIWWRPNYLQIKDENLLSLNSKTLVSEFFNIPDYWGERTRGDNQKLTYRTNRLHNSFHAWDITPLFSSAMVGERLLFSFDISALSTLFDYRKSRWFVPAASKDEAQVVFETMVLVPLGQMDDRRRERSWDIRCHGLSKWFNYEPANSQTIAGTDKTFSSQKEELLKQLKKLEDAKSETDMRLAILNQFRMFVSDDQYSSVDET